MESVDVLYPFLFGASLKLYDDFTDMKLVTDLHAMELLKSVNIMLLAVLCYKDAPFAFYILIVMYFTHGADDAHWKSYLWIALLLGTLYARLPDHLLLWIGWVVFSVVLLNMEHHAVPEEVSLFKLMSRLAMVTVCILLYQSSFVTSFLAETLQAGDVGYLYKIIGMYIGTLLTSSAMQTYLLWQR